MLVCDIVFLPRQMLRRSLEKSIRSSLISEGCNLSLSMPTEWRYGSPGEMPPAAVHAFNSLVHTIAGQSDSSWSVFELFKAKFSGGCSTSSSESWQSAICTGS